MPRNSVQWQNSFLWQEWHKRGEDEEERRWWCIGRSDCQPLPGLYGSADLECLETLQLACSEDLQEEASRGNDMVGFEEEMKGKGHFNLLHSCGKIEFLAHTFS